MTLPPRLKGGATSECNEMAFPNAKNRQTGLKAALANPHCRARICVGGVHVGAARTSSAALIVQTEMKAARNGLGIRYGPG